MGRRKKGLPLSGWLNFHKPLGMTSTQAVGKCRWLLDARKAGHGGTLDPLATGVLPLAFGEATKVLPYLVDARKVYRFEVCWGAQTATDDLEGDVLEESPVRPSQSDILKTLPRFTGVIEQVPPIYSAIKINGERAYDMARRGEVMQMASRQVTLYRLVLLEAKEGSASFEAECSKGTYIRSLGRDMARALGTLGHITVLQRCRVGPFSLKNAITLETLEELEHKPQLLLPLETVLDDIPALAITAEEAQKIGQGQALSRPDAPEGDVLLTYAGRALAIAQGIGSAIQPRRVFQLSDQQTN